MSRGKRKQKGRNVHHNKYENMAPKRDETGRIIKPGKLGKKERQRQERKSSKTYDEKQDSEPFYKSPEKVEKSEINLEGENIVARGSGRNIQRVYYSDRIYKIDSSVGKYRITLEDAVTGLNF